MSAYELQGLPSGLALAEQPAAPPTVVSQRIVSLLRDRSAHFLDVSWTCYQITLYHRVGGFFLCQVFVSATGSARGAPLRIVVTDLRFRKMTVSRPFLAHADDWLIFYVK